MQRVFCEERKKDIGMEAGLITPFADLIDECRTIDEFMGITPSDNIEEIVERGNALIVYINRTGKMLADAKYHLNTVRKSDIMKIIREIIPEKLSAKVQNTLVDTSALEQQFLVDWCERLNRTATHQLDWMRSLISKAKVEMQTGLNN